MELYQRMLLFCLSIIFLVKKSEAQVTEGLSIADTVRSLAARLELLEKQQKLDIAALREEIKNCKGLPGPPGAPGEQGFTGIVGPTGRTGYTGSTGPVGQSGETGATGRGGPSGRTGGTGATGGLGPTGRTGGRGGRGRHGQRGDTGATGIEGRPGQQGARGTSGRTGATGATGSAGQRGDMGAAGSEGPIGRPGRPGPIGPSGRTGGTGATGPAGQRGDTGAIRSEGLIGPPGRTGPTGRTGATGKRGPTGRTGATGPAGRTGETVTTKAAGPTGFTGVRMTVAPPEYSNSSGGCVETIGSEISELLDREGMGGWETGEKGKVVLVIDNSATIDAAVWNEMLQIIIQPITDNDTDVAVVTFSSQSQVAFNLNTYGNGNAIKEAIINLPQVRSHGPKNLWSAIDLAMNEVILPNMDENSINKIIILGMENPAEYLPQARNSLMNAQNAGVETGFVGLLASADPALVGLGLKILENIDMETIKEVINVLEKFKDWWDDYWQDPYPLDWDNIVERWDNKSGHSWTKGEDGCKTYTKDVKVIKFPTLVVNGKAVELFVPRDQPITIGRCPWLKKELVCDSDNTCSDLETKTVFKYFMTTDVTVVGTVSRHTDDEVIKKEVQCGKKKKTVYFFRIKVEYPYICECDNWF